MPSFGEIWCVIRQRRQMFNGRNSIAVIPALRAHVPATNPPTQNPTATKAP